MRAWYKCDVSHNNRSGNPSQNSSTITRTFAKYSRSPRQLLKPDSPSLWRHHPRPFLRGRSRMCAMSITFRDYPILVLRFYRRSPTFNPPRHFTVSCSISALAITLTSWPLWLFRSLEQITQEQTDNTSSRNISQDRDNRNRELLPLVSLLSLLSLFCSFFLFVQSFTLSCSIALHSS